MRAGDLPPGPVPAMNVHLRRWWLRGLRSGYYRHTPAAYFRTRFPRPLACAEGVLAHIIVGEEGAELRLSGESLGDAIARRAGLTPEQSAGIERLELTGATFAQIADWIETNIPITDYERPPATRRGRRRSYGEGRRGSRGRVRHGRRFN